MSDTISASAGNIAWSHDLFVLSIAKSIGVSSGNSTNKLVEMSLCVSIRTMGCLWPSISRVPNHFPQLYQFIDLAGGKAWCDVVVNTAGLPAARSAQPTLLFQGRQSIGFAQSFSETGGSHATVWLGTEAFSSVLINGEEMSATCHFCRTPTPPPPCDAAWQSPSLLSNQIWFVTCWIMPHGG